MQSDPICLAAKVIPVILPQLPNTGQEVCQGEVTRGPTRGAEVQPVVVSSITQLCHGQRLIR